MWEDIEGDVEDEVDRQGMQTFTITADAEELDDDESDHEDGDPDADVNVFGALPKLDRDTGGCDLEREDQQPSEGIVPSDGKSPDVWSAV